MATALELLHQAMELQMRKIEKLVPCDYEISILLRHREMPPEKNADLFFTKDDPEKVVGAINRLSRK